MVKFEQTSESFPAKNRPVAWERIGCMLREQEQVLLALMRSFVKVMMLDIFGDGMPEGSLAEENHTVEAFVFDRPDEPFGERVQVRGTRRQGEWFYSGRTEDHVEAGGEFGVAIPDEVPAFGKKFTTAGREIAGGLPHPVVGWIAGDPADVDFSAGNMDEEQAAIGDQTKWSPNFGGEEIGCEKTVGMRFNKVSPACLGLALGSRINTMFFKDVCNRLVADDMAEGGQRSGDSAISPSRILAGELENQIESLSNSTTDLGYDADGNTLNDQNGQTYKYDAWNRLVSVTTPGGDTITYTYDALGRKITSTDSISGVTTNYYYSSSGQVLEERQGSTVTGQFVWGPSYVNQLIQETNAAGTKFYVQQDANWNITSLTNSSGSVVERYIYDPYGAVTVLGTSGTVLGTGLSHSTVGQQFGFQGGWTDVKTGLTLFGARWLTANGTWLNEDPTGGLYINGADLYQGFVGNPIDLVDPTGLGAAVGHHYVPQSITSSNSDSLSPEAQQVFRSDTSGPTDPSHNYGPQESIKHSDYNAEVRAELQKYMKEKGISPKNKMSEQQAKEFEELIKNSKNPLIRKFNKGVNLKRVNDDDDDCDDDLDPDPQDYDPYKNDIPAKPEPATAEELLRENIRRGWTIDDNLAPELLPSPSSSPSPAPSPSPSPARPAVAPPSAPGSGFPVMPLPLPSPTLPPLTVPSFPGVPIGPVDPLPLPI
jgi:RHS repeat-associated protein